MKVLRLDTDDFSTARLMADSAVRPDRRPLFLPEDIAGITCTPRVAVRVERLGKNVAPRFADRYLTAVCLCCYVTSPSMTDYSDDSLIIGRYLPIADVAREPAAAYEVAFAAEALAALSATATFKTGDLIVLPPRPCDVPFSPAALNEYCIASADNPDDPLLQFTIR